MSDPRTVARAVDALRRGWPIAIDGHAFLAIETGDDTGLADFDASGRADILISGQRATTLKLANQRAGTPTGPVRIARVSWLDLTAATALADPALDLSTPLQGPFRTIPDPAPAASAAALRLARRAGLLPAFFVADAGLGEVALTSQAVALAEAAPSLRIASRAALPTRAAAAAEIVAFRSIEDASEHVALLIGTPDGHPPLVRLHSECLTGDALGSLKCDCGPQLDAAIAAIAEAGWGLLLYLRQEGRAIGLVNKLRAYRLQDQGFDTVDANLRLGFGDDEREFAIAARMLALLGQPTVRLLTNNPRKVESLAAAGIEIADRVPLRIDANVHNAAYLAVKRDRSGHLL